MSAFEPRYYVLRDETLRSWVASFVLTAPLGCVVTVEPARRSRAQNALLHALISGGGRGWHYDGCAQRGIQRAGLAMMWRLLDFHDFEHFARCPGCFGIIIGSIATAVTMGAAWLFG